MISKNDEYVLGVALANERVASEIVARVIDVAPATDIEAQDLLDIIKPSEKQQKEIEEYLIVACASRAAGKEIAEKIDFMVKAIEHKAKNEAAPLAAAQSQIKDLSDSTKEILIVTLANRAVAKRIAEAIDVAGEAIKNM